jgi:hypothetical protein
MIPEWYGNLTQAPLPAMGRNVPLPTAILAQKDEPRGDPGVQAEQSSAIPAIEDLYYAEQEGQ